MATSKPKSFERKATALDNRASLSSMAPTTPRKDSNSVSTSKGAAKSISKQDAVLSMLRSANGTTIAAIMKATGWQQHSIRGFLAGVVKKKLKLKLSSKKAGEQRFYKIVKSGSRT